jgi:aminobenzoyl-glutamate utilization protein B
LKGLIVAAKTLALSTFDIFESPGTIKQAKAELIGRRGPDFNYYALLGERKPPLDYRN